MKYSKFYALLNRMPVKDEEMKARLVSLYTNNRTTSLRDMVFSEYKKMCDDMEKSLKDSWSIQREELKKNRSTALHIMQRLGIDTSDWTRINAFCRDARIAGKEFISLTSDELDVLAVKLRSIERNGGLKPLPQKSRQSDRNETKQIVYILQPQIGLKN